VIGLRRSGGTQPSELALVVDREKAQHVGANPQVVAGVVGYALRGSALPKYRDQGREIPVRVRFQEKDRESLAELANFQVPTDSGAFLPLSALTSTRFLKAPDYIVRRDKTVGRSITLELAEEGQEETRARLAMLQSSIDLPEGIAFAANRQMQQRDEDLEGLQFALLLSIVFIYLLMGFLFSSSSASSSTTASC
jgi:HAE1 family hydrophobic/amphiphilic exporter-1